MGRDREGEHRVSGVHIARAEALGWDLVHSLKIVEEPVELMQSEEVGDGEPWQGRRGRGGVGEAVELRPGLVFRVLSGSWKWEGRAALGESSKVPSPHPHIIHRM